MAGEDETSGEDGMALDEDECRIENMYDRFENAVGLVAWTGSCVLTCFQAWPGDVAPSPVFEAPSPVFEAPSPGIKGLGSKGAASSGRGRGSRSGLGENGLKDCEPDRRSAGADC